MIRLTFVFVWMMQIALAFLTFAFIYALVFHPASIGETVAQIIIGFQNAFK